MDFTEQLRVIQNAQGHPAKLALVTVDLAFPELAGDERDVLKTALETAAIPHWCDETILAGLLEIAKQESAALLARLRGLSVVETFPARGSDAMNVHEASRLALRKMLAADLPRFRAISARATSCFADDLTPAGRVEWIYHLLCGDPERGATELEKLDREWSSAARPEDRYALAAALRELDGSGVVQGRAQVWALIVSTWTRSLRGEGAQLAGTAKNIFDLAKTVDDPSAEAEAQYLLGDALQAQGKLTQANAVIDAALAIRKRLAEQDPGNTGWQSALAEAYIRVGAGFEMQHKLTEAQAAFEAALSVIRRLAEQHPDNSAWQGDLAVAHVFVGGVFDAQGKSTEARAAFEAALAINQRLAEQQPRNVRWQRELAVAHSWLGAGFEAQGDLTTAQAEFEATLSTHQRLVKQDPYNFSWQRELTVAHNRLGGVFEAQGKLTEARAEFEISLAIIQRLAEKEPSNALWQRDLAVTHNRLGGVFEAQGKLTEAQAAFETSLAIHLRLAEHEPSNALWQTDLAANHNRLGGVLEAQGKLTEAHAAYEAERAIKQRSAASQEGMKSDAAPM